MRRECVRGGHELRVHQRFESLQARRDGVGQRVFADDGVGGFQAVAGDAYDGGFVGRDASLVDQFFRHARSNAAGGFRKDSFRFGKQLDGGDDFRIGNVFRPAAGFADLFYGVRPVGGIADGQRTRNGFGFLRFKA